MDVKKIVSQSKFAQVGFVVNDIEKAKKQFALLFGCEIPPTCDCGTFDVTQTQVYGKPAPDAACVMAFFDMSPGVQLELIQPNKSLLYGGITLIPMEKESITLHSRWMMQTK